MKDQPTSLADGRYLLVKPLGEGGMATVFRAFDQRLQVWRAVKILSPSYAEKPRIKARFETEAQTMALLEHRHIVRVYDVGHDGEQSYIVMELLEGGSLVDWLERHGTMPPRLAIDVTLEICEGIGAAHAKGVIHRDIKPHNILVAADGMCRVTDFGIARVGDTDANLTKTGAVMGTWGYMAPEQRTNAKGVDARADVYAVGATLYTLLTNKMPMDLFAADRDPEMLEGIPEPLAAVLIKATDYHRDDRYASVQELAKALQEVRGLLPENPADLAPLAAPTGAPLPIPNPKDYVVERVRNARTDPSGAMRDGGTILPSEGVGAVTAGTIVADGGRMHAPTMAPDEGELLDGNGPTQDRALWAPSDPTLDRNPRHPREPGAYSDGAGRAGATPSPAQRRPSRATPQPVQRRGSVGIDPSREGRTAPPPPEREEAPAASGSGFKLVGAAIVGVVLVGLLVAAVGGGMYLASHGTSASASPAEPVAQVAEVKPPPKKHGTGDTGDAKPIHSIVPGQKADPNAPPITVDPKAADPKAADPKATSSTTSSTMSSKATEPKSGASSKSTTSSKTTESKTSTPTTSSGTSESTPSKGTAEAPQTVVTVPTAQAQCVHVTPPTVANVGGAAVFKASLCNEDGTEVTLWFRPAGGTWQSRLMPKALGSHMAKIQIDDSYSAGLEYYVVAGATGEGTQGSPLRIAVR